jgi:spore maturation protein CgeB
MSTKDLLSAYKEQITSLIKEKKDLVVLTDEKDLRIKKLLIQLEQSNDDVQNLGKKIAELEQKSKKKDKIKRIINQKIDEVLETKEEIVVDNDE